MAGYLKKTGEIAMTTGLVSLGVMAIVGTVAIDIVILAYIMKQNESDNRNHRNDNSNTFFTGMLVGQMFSNQNRGDDLGIKLLLSPLFSLAAVGLSFLLGVPYIGLGLLAGWGVAMGITLLGLGICKLADYLDPGFGGAGADVTSIPVHSTDHASNSNAYNPIHGHAPSAPPVPVEVGGKQNVDNTSIPTGSMADYYCRFHAGPKIAVAVPVPTPTAVPVFN